MLAANPIFFWLLSKSAYTLCRITTNHCRIVLMDIHLIFAIITIQYRPCFFTTASVKTLLSLIRLSSSLVDTWSLVYHLIANVVSDLCSWAFLIAHLDIFHCKTFGHKSHWSCSDLWKSCNEFGHIVFYPCFELLYEGILIVWF